MQWIHRNQLARRNVTPEEAAYHRGKLYEAVKGQQGGDRKSEKSKGKNCPLIDTAEQLAAELHVAPRTIKNDAAFAKGVDAIAEARRITSALVIWNPPLPSAKRSA